MNNLKFHAEYELRASPKMLYPYISTAAGLQQWFADKVTISPDHVFDFLWDKESHRAKLAQQRLNKLIRFEFFNNSNTDVAYTEFRLDTSDFTGTTFFRITDCTPNQDAEDLQDQWDSLIDKLKHIVGS